MNTKTTLPISEARKRIFDIANEVQKPNKYYTLTENGRPKAVMMSAEDFESWVETLEVAKDFPDVRKEMSELKADLKTGAHKKYTSLDELLVKGGYILPGAQSKTHAISRRSKTTRRKRAR